jgi:N-hydroxyarylamine O-acetyltransferase
MRLTEITDIAAYLKRIDYAGSLEPTADVLQELHHAHILAVPFENLDIHLGRPIVLNEAHLFEKIVNHRRGGFCYELNGLFAALLRALGFEVDLLSARVYDNGRYGPEFDHLILRVHLEEVWLADVGFGDSFREPLQLYETGNQVQAGVPYRIEHQPPGWKLSSMDGFGDWRRSYRFSLKSRALSEFREMCRYHQTSPDSSFTQKRLCTRATPEGRITLSEMRLIITKGGQRREQTLVNEEEYLSALDHHFGIRLS